MSPKMKLKSTMAILKERCGRDKPDLYRKLEGIPKFDPIRHSDGCSGGMSEGYEKLQMMIHENVEKTLPWRGCCVIHDETYYYGGSKEEKIAADKKLKNCVANVVGKKGMGHLLGSTMELAVKIGGKPYFSTSYRWGYGEDFKETDKLPVKD